MLEKSIIFDLDGTLWDTSKEIEYVWKNVAENYKIKINKEKIKKIMGFTKDEIIKYLLKEIKEKEMNLLQSVKIKKTNTYYKTVDIFIQIR